MKEFRLHVPEDDVLDLRGRLARTRWPEASTEPGWGQGVPLDYCQELCAYWRDQYDWRGTEARFNTLPQFRTPLEGLDVHFVHLRSARADAIPLLIGHGWPGTVFEMLDILQALTLGDPAFHVVLPSLPGFGLSDKPTTTGWGIDRAVRAWDRLMGMLGYDSYVVHGPDWGSYLAGAMGAALPGRVRGIHITLPMADKPTDADAALSEREQARLAEVYRMWQTDSGYAAIMSTKPQSIGYGLTDSPAGLLAWVVEKFWSWSDHDGDDVEKAIPRDRMLDIVSLHWFASAGASASRIYWESYRKVPYLPVSVPTGVSSFPKDASTPRAWAQRRYTDLRFWRDHVSGGHFPALERPELLVADLREFAGTLE
ncbi:epoxide hydrolase family protein [Allorhizocola rhizosphaerae]|uniref:epoxide hydrolase family protein n=1 Tax=Allorhizocola rhizosphaerae TaxID=1872709 RepID=UPI000E3CB71E|nr:epoxide hydrolase family protein [Allorhizocola rhizosphaerae]